MMKRKLLSLGVIASLIGLLIGSYYVSNQHVKASETIVVNEGETYTQTFQDVIAPKSLTDGSVIILDANEKEVKEVLSLDETGKKLMVKNLPKGKYTLQVKREAYVKGTKLHRNLNVAIDVVEKVKNISSKEELKKYFETYLALEQAAYSSMENAVTAESEAATSNSKMEQSMSDKGSGGNYSTTNNQVDGIEEGDITLTDGEYLYTLADNHIVIIDAKKLNVVKRLTISKNVYPTNLMLHDKTLIVSYSEYIELQREPYYDSKSLTKLAFYDVSDAKNPKLIREVGQDGDMINIRKSGNYVYLVTNRTPNYWMLPEAPNMELRPASYDNGVEKLLPYDQIRILPESNQPSYLLVSAIDISDVSKATWTTESFLGNSGQLYMSPNAIYIASMNYSWLPFVSSVAETSLVDGVTDAAIPSTDNETTIYKIKVDKTKISMAAEGKVKGSVLNQYSMDEHNGYFRIATTEGNAWRTDADSKNHLFILDDKLKQVGAVNDLAKGERIYSARFIGDKAYLVTFKETDPLFVIDTSKPEAPKVLGELKIPGFSNYLHPIDENHLLGIGYETEVRMEEGVKEPVITTGGMKLSLFDITDFKNPKEQQAVVIGGRGTYSSVQYDFKALFRDPRNQLFGFPVTIYRSTADEDRLQYEGTGAHLYKVTANGIERVAELMEKARPGEQYEDSYHVVQRILYVNDELFTVSRSKVTSYNGKTFEKQQMIGY
jgi:inhibitor of cysteine peptidase